VWRIDGTGRPIVLKGHKDWVVDAHFSPDGKRVVTASHDGTARVWRVDWKELLVYLRESTTACLNVHQRKQYLRERTGQAEAVFEQCERRYGREPRPEP
jgi:WD40 repeat protein